MIKLSDSIKTIIHQDSFLTVGFYHRLLNLSQTAKFIKSILEARTKKTISQSALLMSLSRLNKQLTKITPKPRNIGISKLTIRSSLCSITFLNALNVLNKIDKVYNKIQQKNGYIIVNQGTNEVTMVIEEQNLPLLQKLIPDKPEIIKNNLTALGIQFEKKYSEIPGFTYCIIQPLVLQNINIWEFSSTYTELILYINEKDINLAFDTIYHCFLEKKV